MTDEKLADDVTIRINGGGVRVLVPRQRSATPPSKNCDAAAEA